MGWRGGWGGAHRAGAAAVNADLCGTVVAAPARVAVAAAVEAVAVAAAVVERGGACEHARVAAQRVAVRAVEERCMHADAVGFMVVDAPTH